MATLWISGTDLSQLIGREKAEALLREYAGRQIYIPINASRQKFTPVIGEEANEILSREFPGIDVSFPSTIGRPPLMKERIRELIEQGRTCSEVIRQIGCSERYFHMVSGDAKLNPRKRAQDARTGTDGEA